MGGHFLLVGRGRWRWVEVYFGWIGVGGHFLWVGGGTFFIGGWRDIFYGWVRVGGGRWTFFMDKWGYISCGWCSWTFFMGGLGWMKVDGGIFWVERGRWTFFMGGWGWVEWRYILGEWVVTCFSITHSLLPFLFIAFSILNSFWFAFCNSFL